MRKMDIDKDMEGFLKDVIKHHRQEQCRKLLSEVGKRQLMTSQMAENMESLKFACFETQWGWIAVMGSPTGLFRTTVPMPDEGSAINSITQGVSANREDAEFAEIKQTFIDYFMGKEIDFCCPVDLEGCTDFQRDVWEAATSIPYGQLRNYKWIANRIGRPLASRAVGRALGSNRLPIVIPCHRVVRSDGGLGGYLGGLQMKEKLIKLESAVS